MTIKVLVVDDSALVRSLLGEIILQAPGMTLVGAAPDAYVAREMIKQYSPDVITLDIEMPRMDGLTFLEKLMAARPTPVIMISTLTEAGAEASLRALELGAVDFVPKPRLGVVEGLREYAELIIEKIHEASVARVKPVRPIAAASSSSFKPLRGTEKIIAIGASTGGTEAIKDVLIQFPAAIPGVVITQHMPANFTRTFAQRLDKLCRLNVKEAQGGERILPGTVFLAPGGYHLRVVRSGADYVTQISEQPPVHRHRPSVDVMFDSLAEAGGPNVIAMLLTGMGKDGAQGLLKIRQAGGFTLAQDEASCVVYGMPREAVQLGAAVEELPLEALAPRVLEFLEPQGVANRL